MTAMAFDWVQLARELDQDLDTFDPDAWAKLTAEEQAAHPFGKMFETVRGAVLRERARKSVEAATLDSVPFVVSTEADIMNRPSPKWLVADLIQESTICMLAGPGGLGKSFLALGIARAMASGGPFFGKAVQQGKTLYVVAEGAAAFGDRVKAWNEAHPVLTVPADAIAYVEQGVNLKDAASVQTLADMVREGAYSLVILDTLSQLAYLDNENNNAEVALTFRAIKSIRDAREGTTVLVLDHTPVNGGKVRGATSKRDNSDTVIMAIPTGDTFSLSTMNEDGGKQKDGKAIEWHGFSLAPVGNSAIVVNNGGTRPLSPYWSQCLPVLQDKKPHGTTELREATGITGTMQSAEGKRLKTELDHWVRDGLVIREGSTKSTTYRLSEQAAGVLA
jgi:RecA-family ATPase